VGRFVSSCNGAKPIANCSAKSSILDEDSSRASVRPDCYNHRELESRAGVRRALEEREAMARLRKKHLQQAFEFRSHGGKREGAGRPRKGRRSSEPHKKRAKIKGRYPLHITTRVLDDVGPLRRKDTYHVIREATGAVFRHDGFRIVHLSVQGNHLHLIAEATNNETLAKGVQVFLSAAARGINRALRRRAGVRRRGQVFADRYHERELTTPRAVRHTICYVLNNWRRHAEDRAPKTRAWNVDPFSSGVFFDGWKERESAPLLFQPPPTYQWLMTWFPKTWLLREGWKKHGLISLYEVPGPAPKPKPSCTPRRSTPRR
jgi:REP element-mobilizing transposase RayT